LGWGRNLREPGAAQFSQFGSGAPFVGAEDRAARAAHFCVSSEKRRPPNKLSFKKRLDRLVSSCFVLPMTHKGWHNRGYLPHFDARALVQHIVLCTRTALELESLRLLASSPIEERPRLADAMLDRSQDGAVFRDPVYVAALEEQILFFDGIRYDALAWCIMPNHAHVVICCHSEISLGQIVRTWKNQTLRAATANPVRKAEIFAKDYFDRFMRNGLQTERTIAYVEQNPVTAGLCAASEDWRFSSAWHRSRGWTPRTENLPVSSGSGSY